MNPISVKKDSFAIIIRTNNTVEVVNIPEPSICNLEGMLGDQILYHRLWNSVVCPPDCFAIRKHGYLDNSEFNSLGSILYGHPVYGDAAIIREEPIAALSANYSTMTETEANVLAEEIRGIFENHHDTPYRLFAKEKSTNE